MKRLSRHGSCLKKNLNASRPFEHPSIRGENVKTFRWDHRLQIRNLFISHSAFWLPTRKNYFHTVANPARGLLNRGKRNASVARKFLASLSQANAKLKYRSLIISCYQAEEVDRSNFIFWRRIFCGESRVFF